jgi:hypothetical protein
VDESYTIYVAAAGGVNSIVGGATIEANTIYGAIRGLETFSQLCVFNYDTKNVEVRHAPWYIEDEPRFAFRGLLLDTSRHFLPVDVIKQVIDSMSFSKLNVLHWHIIDEQSFPLEVPSYPKLWKGSYSKLERYTVEDARDIVRYQVYHLPFAFSVSSLYSIAKFFQFTYKRCSLISRLKLPDSKAMLGKEVCLFPITYIFFHLAGCSIVLF